jgi:hypothetical protein
VFKDVDFEVRWTNEMWKGVMEAHGEARPEATTHTIPFNIYEDLRRKVSTMHWQLPVEK